MGIFRKKETYNEQMLREAGLDRVVFRNPAPPSEPEPTPAAMPMHDPLGSLEAVRATRGVPREWDTTTTARGPGIEGERAEFVVLPDGDLIVENEEGDGDLSPLADAIEEHIPAPYRAVASRQDGDLWGVGAKRIEVATMVFPDGDTLLLSQSHGATELRVNGEPSDAVPPVELQRLGERTGGDFCVEARRVDGDAWEVKVSPL